MLFRYSNTVVNHENYERIDWGIWIETFVLAMKILRDESGEKTV